MVHPINWSLVLPYYSIALAFGYLLGSIPFGVILTRLAGMADIRSVGSGNIGATNVLRTGNKALAAATLAGDMLKGTLAVVVMYQLWGRDLAIIAALGAFIGHLFPVWLRFKGGKGVATYIGLLLGLALWIGTLAFCGLWVIVAAITRYSSLAALAASAATPAVLWFNGDRQQAQLFAVLSVLLWLKHAGNIRRLISGTEGRIGRR
jgi:glycerol-3-phosphate acyltransferase PlsY